MTENLLYDVPRCPGVSSVEDEVRYWREGCETCLRRTSPGHPTRQVMIAPPPVIVFECEFLIEPRE